MQAAYIELHDWGTPIRGNLVEAGWWAEPLRRVPGQGIFGESMFHHKNDASKVALGDSGGQTKRWGFASSTRK